MKKIFSNIRTMAALLMAGAAFAACSSSDDIIENQQPANNGKQAYTLTINASKDGAATRALTDDNGAIVASWKTTDVIHVTQADGTEIGTLSPTSINGLTATFTGTISGDAQINESDVLTLTYHPIASFSAFASQDGTLSGSANSAENYDMAVATVTISAITGNTITVSESQANFVNQTAVVVLKPYNSSWSEYHSLNSLTVSVTMNNVPVAGTVTEHFGPFTLSGDQPYYFALPSQASLAKTLAAKYSLAENAVSALLASATITFTGHQTGDDYDREYLTCSKTGYKFAAGKYYKLDNSNFSMTMLYKRAAAGKDVYVSSSNPAWSNTVTFAVNKEIGWKVVGDYVFCGDKQLYVVDNSGPEPSEGWVRASDDHIPFDATYSLRTTVTWDFSQLSGLESTPYVNGGVTLSGEAFLDFDNNELTSMSELTFTAPSGKKFTSIVITASGWKEFYGTGWSGSTWSDPNGQTTINFMGGAGGISTIVFTLADVD